MLWVMLGLMSVMVFTWTYFWKQKAKTRIVFVLAVLMWLQTFIELLGYIIYPKSEDRYCENPAVPHHHGFNYCAVSAMLVFGIINPMFQVMMAFMAVDLYMKFIMKMKHIDNYYKWYTIASFLLAFCGKFIPVFIVGEAGGFDGVNACGYTFLIRQPRSVQSPTPVELINEKLKLDLSEILLMNTIDHLAWLICLLFLVRVIAFVVNQLRATYAGGDMNVRKKFKKIIMSVITPIVMCFIFTIISAVQIYFWDMYAIENWEFFGPGGKPMAKTYNDALSLSMYYQYINEDGLQVVYSQWESIDDLTRVYIYIYPLNLNIPLFLIILITICLVLIDPELLSKDHWTCSISHDDLFWIWPLFTKFSIVEGVQKAAR